MKNIDSRLLNRLGTLRQFAIFLKVAELGSIAQAAEALFLTQPSVSIQIRKLSETLGVTLYEMVGKKLYLTEEGERVAQTGRELAETLNRLDSDLNNLQGLQAGTLTIAVDSSAKYFMPQLLGPFLGRYPGVNLSFHEGERSELVSRLRDNRDDLYIFSELPADIDIEHYPFLPNPLVVIAPASHPLVARKRIRWEEISGDRILLPGQGSGARRAVDSFLDARGWRAENPLDMGSEEVIRRSVMANIGIAIMTAYGLAEAERDGLVQLRVEGFPVMSEWQIIHRKNKRLSLVAQAFLDFLGEEAESHLRMDLIRERVRKAQSP